MITFRQGFGASLPPGFFDPLTAADIAHQNWQAAQSRPEAVRLTVDLSSLNGAGWLLLSDSERAEIRKGAAFHA